MYITICLNLHTLICIGSDSISSYTVARSRRISKIPQMRTVIEFLQCLDGCPRRRFTVWMQNCAGLSLHKRMRLRTAGTSWKRGLDVHSWVRLYCLAPQTKNKNMWAEPLLLTCVLGSGRLPSLSDCLGSRLLCVSWWLPNFLFQRIIGITQTHNCHANHEDGCRSRAEGGIADNLTKGS